MLKALVVSLLLTSAVGAKTPPTDRLASSAADRVLVPMRNCRAVSAAVERLACFDAAAAALDEQISTHQITVVDQEGVREVKRSLFGFSLPSINLFGERGERKKDETQVSTIDTTIKSVRLVSADQFELALPDGARWINTDSLPRQPRPGDKISIHQGMLSNYFMRIADGRTVRGRRVQ